MIQNVKFINFLKIMKAINLSLLTSSKNVGIEKLEPMSPTVGHKKQHEY